MATKEKGKLKRIILSIVVLALLIAGACVYHTKKMSALRAEVVAEQKQAQEQQELLEKRVNEINDALLNSEEERDSLTKKLEEMMVEDVFYFDSAMIMEEIKEIGELASIEYRYTNVGTLDADKKLFKTGISLPGSKKTVVVTMDGIIKVGIDVEGIKITSSEASKTITVTLPKAKLLSNELDEESIRVYDETAGLFNKVTMEDSSALRTQIKKKSEENAQKNGVFDQAQENAQVIIRCMLEAIPGLKGAYTIQFK